MKEDKCENCKHWELTEDPYGCCRYSPPVPRLGSPKEETYTNWPRVQKDDWCSHHEKTEPKTLTKPKGIFRWIGRNIIEPCYERCSLNYRLKQRFWGGKNVPEWFSEVYVLLWVISITTLFLIFKSKGIPRWCLVFPGYKILETLIFFVHWILLATTPLYSYKRSLVCIFFNLVEIAVYSAIAFVLFGCFSFRDALYNSGISILTFSAINLGSASWQCKSVMVFELLVADFLILIIVASLVGQLKRREGYGQGK